MGIFEHQRHDISVIAALQRTSILLFHWCILVHLRTSFHGQFFGVWIHKRLARYNSEIYRCRWGSLFLPSWWPVQREFRFGHQWPPQFWPCRLVPIFRTSGPFPQHPGHADPFFFPKIRFVHLNLSGERGCIRICCKNRFSNERMNVIDYVVS